MSWQDFKDRVARDAAMFNASPCEIPPPEVPMGGMGSLQETLRRAQARGTHLVQVPIHLSLHIPKLSSEDEIVRDQWGLMKGTVSGGVFYPAYRGHLEFRLTPDGWKCDAPVLLCCNERA